MFEGMDDLIMANMVRDILSRMLKETVEDHEGPHSEKRGGHKKNNSRGEVFLVVGGAFE